MRERRAYRNHGSIYLLARCGGESGARQARMMDPDWVRSVLDQCEETGIAFFVKQMTKLALIPKDLFIREWPR
jgi:protein gp37